jgi:transposase
VLPLNVSETEKKIVHASERETERVCRARDAFRALGLEANADALIFFDESGVNLSMARAYGRARRGQRAVGHVPKNWGDNITLSAGLSTRGLIAPLMLTGSMTGEIFEAYIEQFVVPELRPGDVVVMDNLSAHKLASVRQLIEAVGARLLYLPPYSPDFSPIELAWSKVKTLMRGLAARTLETLEHAIVHALRAITPSDARGWFRHCGY